MARSPGLAVVCLSALLWTLASGADPVWVYPDPAGTDRVPLYESASDGTLVLTLSATDADAGDTLTYSLVTASNDFEIVSSELRVKTGASLDYETTPTYPLTIRVTDSTSATADVTVTIDLTDEIDETPTFSSASYTGSVAEGQSAGAGINFGLNVTDADAGDTLTYSLQGTDSSLFSIDPLTGAITTAQVLDREATAIYTQLVIKVTDSASHTATASLTVSVTDINDVTPHCSPAVYTATVEENTAQGTSLVTLTCNDNDEGSNGVVTYSIASRNPGTVFQISTNVLQTDATATDYEGQQTYTLVIHAVDGGTTPKTGTATVVVTVTGTNEHAPSWATWTPAYTATTSIGEDTAVGASILTISATDADNGDDGTITYSIDSAVDSSSNSATGVFRMDPISGQLSTLQSLDRDSGITSYTITFKAEDKGTPTPSSVTRSVTINLNDVNDNAPAFTSSTYLVTIQESAATGGASLVQMSATDADSSPTFTYSIDSSIVGNAATKFEFSTTTAGLLQLASAIDLDAGEAAYSVIKVLVSDGGTNPGPKTGTATVTVSITPTNDHTPAFGATVPAGTISLSELASAGTSIATVTATDGDYGADGTVTFSITGGNTGNAFTIVSTGVGQAEIRTLTTLDYDGPTKTYNLEITATDGGTSPNSATTTVSVTLTDQNDNTPTCTNYYIAVTKTEPGAVNDAITTPSCSDADDTDTLAYSITSGNGDGKFDIDTSTGAITLADILDYDSATQEYTLQVSVTDGTKSQTVTVKVVVAAANEDTPSFASNPTVGPVSESEAAGYSVTTYTASDADYPPHGITQYAITAVSQSGGSLFTIDRSSGVISLLASLDYDALPAGSKYYELTVEATDGGGSTGSGTVTVSVGDVNDNPPSCTQSSWSQTVAESVATFPNTVIASLGCTDPEGTTLNYALTQSPGSHFSIVSGGVQQDSAVDYETASTHVLNIVVSDSGSPALSTTVVVNVIVQNVNDGPPVFGGSYDVTISESVAVGTSVADVSATDPDGTSLSFGRPQHSIISGDASSQFSIDSTTGRVTTRAALDAETTPTNIYYLVIQAMESGGTNSATVTLTVTVSDVNDEIPTCTPTVFTETVTEPGAAGDTVLTLTCTDDDVTATTLTYSITSGDTTKFTMNSNVLELLAQLDYDAGTTKYDLTITVSDGTNSLDVVGSVSVGPVNEHDPAFSTTVYSVTKSEALSVGSTVIRVTATDSDSSSTAHGVVVYSFVSPYSLFTINSATGDIVLSSSLDRETAPTHTLLVTARDSTTTVTATVSVTVSDENDNSPEFSAATYTASVSETATAPASVVTVSATDSDDSATNGNGAVTFSSTIGGANSNHFTIDTTTGEITTTQQLDADTISTYTLTVTAVDRAGGAGSLSSTAVVIVTVTSQNQYDPAFSQTTYTHTTSETTPVGTQLVQVTATDADSGSDGAITYSMATHAKFSLAADGWISVKTALDFDTTPNTYSFEVVATDGGATPRSATATVSITVGDENDNTAICTTNIQTVTKQEDYTGTVATWSCQDADSGTNAALTYSVESVDGVTGAGNFAVDGSGVVSVSSLDYETATSHSVVIKVQDGGTTPRSTSVYLNVIVTDVNENAPTFSGTPFSANVAEDETLGTTILTVTASGNDGSDTVTYSLSDTTYLEADSASGDITLKASFDFETTPTYSVDVCATDSNTVGTVKSACETFSITVTDANDNDPVFSPSVYSANVDENQANGFTVTTVTADDADTLAAGGTITYSLFSGNTDNVFRVDAASGDVIVDDNTYLDYERTTSYSLTVRAGDGGGRTRDAVVTITVNPLNEHTPAFASASSTLPSGLDEDAAVGTTVTSSITATDSDHGADGTLTYSITSGAFGKFGINPTTGEITLAAALDRETTQSYTLQIQAVDGGAVPKTGTHALTINVNDVNDVTPSCSLTYYTAIISENAAASTSVKDLSCSDGDLDPGNLNNALTYAITLGNTGNWFEVSGTGSITVATGATFDRETTPSYTLTLEVADQASTGKLTATVTLQVDISDENDNDPTFTSDPYTASAAENAALGDSVTTVLATDTDTGSNAALTYSLTTDDPSDPGKFKVDASTGEITVAGSLDYESHTAYVLVVTATDQGATPRSGTTTVSIAVTDVNDNPPVCAQSVYTHTLAEDADPATATVVTVSCPDVDTPGVTYSLTDTHFSVNPTTGVVTLTSALDYETAQSHALTITASDGTRTDTTLVQITVTDVNEFDPIFDPTTPYTATVSEDDPIGFTVKDIGATDGDYSDTALTFSITGGNTAGKFTIDSVTGVIQLQGTLDRETTTAYSLTLEVADPRSLTATTSIDITVTDVNDNDPTCTPNVYMASVAEDAAVGDTVVTLTCSDVDSSTPTVAYTLLAAGNTGTAFAINSATGALTVNSALDYETLTEYSLQVEVSDQDTPTARTVTVPVTVTLIPVNEHDPAFSAASYSPSLAESSSVGTSVETVAATDADTGALHGTIRYSIAAGNAQGHFSIDSNSGLISVAKPLDREATDSYSLTVRASDDVAGSANERTADVTVIVTITDDNDNYPVFNPAFYYKTVLESAATGGTVETVTVSDDDAGTNAAITLSILSGNTGNVFSVSGLDILLANPLDFETQSSYDLVLLATDGGTPALTAQARLTINVGPVNEDPPVLTDATFTDSISETLVIGTLIYTATASDSDQGSNHGTITYAITAGDTSPQSFIVDANSGEVRVFSQLDYDTPPQSYTLTLEASDGGGLTDTVTLALTLLDENDHYPQFTVNTYTTTLDENVATGHTVTSVIATDNDSGVNGQVTYSITGGNGQSSFTIDASTGEITTTAAIDYESVTVLYVVVQAADGGTSSLSSTALVRISVIDLNDNTPVVIPDDYTVTISEATATGTSVAAIAATDADSSADNNNVIVFGLTNADFQVDASSGVITTTNTLDRETTPSYVLTVTATDQGSNPGQNTATATVTVIITDVNDNDPVITSTLHDITVPEDQAVGSIVLTVSATDADIGENARLTYTITGGNTNTDWNMISANGMIQVKNALDRETTPSYLVEVTVSDNGATPRSATVTVTLTVSDVNDNDPVFTGTPYAFSVAENSIVGVSVGRITATDADTGLNANLIYSAMTYWQGDNTHFSLDAATGDLTTAVTSLDRETRDTYVIWCRVVDQGTPQRYDDVNVTITITDVNDNPPIFSGAPYTGSVAENSAVGTSILTVTATDADIGTNGAVTFSIDTSTADGVTADTYLQVDPTSGEISVKANIDYETHTSFTFGVKATDGGTPTLSATGSVTITVTDVNDNRPAFTQAFYNKEIAYAGQCDNSVATPVCNDADSGVNGQVVCYLVESTYNYLFAVDVSTCSVTTQAIAAANSRYVIDLQCRDSGSPTLTASTPTTIRVDTFIPDNTVVKFQLSISRTDFEARRATFLSNLQALVRVNYPTARLELWCIQERSGTATAPATGRRKLLQTEQPVDVMVYTVSDDTTDDPANSGEAKTFLSSDELMAYFAADASGTPSSAVTGGTWDYYGIQKVTEYREESTPWIQTTEGIAVVTVACVLGLALIILLIVVIIVCVRKRKRPVTPERRVMVEEGKEETKPKPTWMKKPPPVQGGNTGGVPDVDKSNSTQKANLATAAIAATAFTAYNKQKAVTPPRQSPRLTTVESDSPPEEDNGRKRSVVTPRTVLLVSREEEGDYPVKNRDFDGRALDPNTGKVYEYNTKTGERRWLESPPSY